MFNADHPIAFLNSFNRKAIFNTIRVEQCISRIELSQKIGMSATAVTRLINDFIEAGMVSEVGIYDVDTVGRKPIMLSIRKDCMYALGVSIDIGEITMGCINVNGEMVYATSASAFDASDPESVVGCVAELYHDVMAHLEESARQRVIGIGVSIPGLVDWPEGNTRLSPQLHWNSFPLRDRLRLALGIEVLVDNNVRAIATAESMFAGKQAYDSFCVLEVGSGLGSAYVMEGKVMRGTNGFLGEIGHSLLVEDGELCDCGRRGCLQAYTCITGLENRLNMPIEQIIELRNQDMRVQVILTDAVRYLSALVANLVNYYNPGAMMVGGRLFAIWPELFDALQAYSARLVWQPAQAEIRLQRSSLPGDSLRVLAAASVFFSDLLLPEAVIRKSVLKPEKRFS